MPALLQAFLRLVALKRLGVLLFVLAAALCAANTASAFERAQTKTRVWDFELAGNNSSGLLTPATNGKHQGNRLALSELASDSLLGPEEALEQLAAKTVEKLVAKEAVKTAPRILNGANHVFGPKSLARHGLEGVLNAFGGDKVAAFNALESGAQQLAGQGAIKGVFQTTVEVAGQNVTVRGAVVDGAARVSTAFIP